MTAAEAKILINLLKLDSPEPTFGAIDTVTGKALIAIALRLYALEEKV